MIVPTCACFDKQALASNGDWKNAMILSICFESKNMSDYSVWAFKRDVRFTDTFLLGFLTKKNVQARNSCMS
jgi:hypothetical protein